MKTKSLLLTAVAASVASTVAFGAVSSNIVGYTKLHLADGNNLVCNTLNAADNHATVLFGATPAGSQVFNWKTGGGFAVLSNLDGAGTWDGTDYLLNPGQAVFVKIPAGGALDLYLVGEVVVNPGSIPLTSTVGSFNFVSSQLPIAGALDTALQFAPNDGDQVFQWNNAKGQYAVSQYAGGWLTDTGNAPNVAIGEGLVITTLTSGASWKQTFTVGQ